MIRIEKRNIPCPECGNWHFYQGSGNCVECIRRLKVQKGLQRKAEGKVHFDACVQEDTRSDRFKGKERKAMQGVCYNLGCHVNRKRPTSPDDKVIDFR